MKGPFSLTCTNSQVMLMYPLGSTYSSFLRTSLQLQQIESQAEITMVDLEAYGEPLKSSNTMRSKVSRLWCWACKLGLGWILGMTEAVWAALGCLVSPRCWLLLTLVSFKPDVPPPGCFLQKTGYFCNVIQGQSKVLLCLGIFFVGE